ncbi:MAG: MarR family winged helix-turn-helix transcriptional regulator [Stellaceae bacterium]
MAGGDAAAIDYGSLPEHLGYVLRRAQLLIFQDFIKSMDGLALRPAQFSLLMVIGHNPGLTQARLGGALRIKSANVVALIDALVGRGLARRSPAPRDRRSHALSLTRKGEALLRQASALAREHERRIARGIGSAGRAQLLALLNALAAGL